MSKNRGAVFFLLLVLALLPVTLWNGCGRSSEEVKIDGSSTVYLITEKVAAEFKKNHPQVNISVGISGTGGGFKKFANGETDISDASRAIKDSEKEKCKANNIDFLELQVALDGLAVIIHKDNDWAEKMTVEQLKKIWHPNKDGFKNAEKWSDVDPKWPDHKIELYGAGTDSGTFDYFTEAINGKEKVCRPDYGASEDDNTTIKGVTGNKYAMGFLGVAYYEAHRDQLKAVAVADKSGDPFMLPTKENVLDGTYKPLSRPLFIYVKKDSLKRPAIQDFCKFYLRRADLVEAVKYVQLPEEIQMLQQKKLDDAIEAVKTK